MKTYDQLSTDLINAIPATDAVERLTTEEIEKLRRIGNMIDNVLYLEILRRKDAAVALLDQML